MRIARIRIYNFRSLHRFEMNPDKGINVLVGENNAGKSALLVALARSLGRPSPVFDYDDFYTTAPSMDPLSLPTICIDVEIRPDDNQPFSTNFTTEFVDQIAFDSTSRPFVLFRTQARYEKTDERIITEFFSVRADDSAMRMFPQRRSALRGYLPFYLVDAFRDTIGDIQGRRGFWGRIVNSITLDTATVSSIERSVHAINQLILAAAPKIGDIENRLREIGNAIPTANPPDDIVVTPITVDPSGILRNLDVVLRTASAPRGFPLARHGEGTRSIAHLAIFRAFVDLLAQEENDNLEAKPIVGVEEPEVHLHPHAIRSIGAMISAPPRQMFLTTHSPELARSVSLDSIQLLRRGVDGSEVRVVPKFVGGAPILDQRDRIKLEHALRAGATEILFSRAVLLCEGESEVQAYPYFAAALGVDLNRLGISLVPVDGSDFYCLIRIMAGDALRIPWVVSADGDVPARLANQLLKLGKVTRAQKDSAEQSNTMETTILRPHDFFTLPNGYGYEEELIRGGAAPEYSAAIVNHVGSTGLQDFLRNTANTSNTVEDQLVDFMKSGAGTGGKKWKVLFAGIVADDITMGGTDATRIPATIVDALQLIQQYADGTAGKAF